jgi:hypothetical protein
MPGPETPRHRTVMVELVAPPVAAPLETLALGRNLPGFAVDEDYPPVPMGGGPTGPGTVIVRGTVVDDEAIGTLSGRDDVVGVWDEGEVAPFS